MILYHGSYKEVDNPDILHSRNDVDFDTFIGSEVL